MEVKRVLFLTAVLVCFGCGKKNDSPQADSPNGKSGSPAPEWINLADADAVFSPARADDNVPDDNKVFAENTGTSSKVVKKFKFATDKKTKIFQWHEHKNFSCESTLPIEAKLTVRNANFAGELSISNSVVVDPGSYDIAVEVSDSRNCKSIEYGFNVAFVDVNPPPPPAPVDTKIINCAVINTKNFPDFKAAFPELASAFGIDIVLLTSDPLFNLNKHSKIILKSETKNFESNVGTFVEMTSGPIGNYTMMQNEKNVELLFRVKHSEDEPSKNQFVISLDKHTIFIDEIQCTNTGAKKYVD